MALVRPPLSRVPGGTLPAPRRPIRKASSMPELHDQVPTREKVLIIGAGPAGLAAAAALKALEVPFDLVDRAAQDRKSTRLNSSHVAISYAVFCLKKKKKHTIPTTTRATRGTRT